MKKTIILTLTIIILLVISLNAQTEKEQINATLMKYIEGTANGEPDKLREAFYPNFNLFLVDSDTLRVIDGKGYIDRVEPDKKYNRHARIIAVDHENDAASAKIEVYFPDSKRIATDYFLLLKAEGQWKIIHKIINVKSYEKVEDLVPTEKKGIEEINETLLHYIEGTANGSPKRLRKAFHPEFNLYYVKNDSLSIISGNRYIENFKEGVKHNRIGNVLAIDHENNAGLAKMQVLMPDRKRIAIDYMLLLKIDGRWQIIHKSFTSKNYRD